jgi:hypothetical protein
MSENTTGPSAAMSAKMPSRGYQKYSEHLVVDE